MIFGLGAASTHQVPGGMRLMETSETRHQSKPWVTPPMSTRERGARKGAVKQRKARDEIKPVRGGLQ